MKLILNMITVFLQSGRKRLVLRGKEALENMKDTGVLDWKVITTELNDLRKIICLRKSGVYVTKKQFVLN